MGDGEYNNLKCYMKNTDTGEFEELQEVQAIEITEAETDNTFSYKNASWDGGTLSFDLSEQNIIEFKRRFVPETINNWRKQHGIQLFRKRHLKSPSFI